MSKKQTYEICVQHLFDDKNRLNHLSPQMLDRLLRIRSAYTLMVEFPSKADREIVAHLMSFSGVEKSQAYEDLRIIRDLLGSINKQSKDWHRFRFNQRIDKAYELAEQRNNPEAMVNAMKAYGKYNQLDREDPDRLPWDQIIPQSFEPTEDPSVIGIKPIANFKQKQVSMMKKYMEQVAEDVTYSDYELKILEKYDQIG